jgi:hypothetical protein
MLEKLAQEICLLSTVQMQELSVILAKSQYGENFSWYLETAIYDKQLTDVEVQEPVC